MKKNYFAKNLNKSIIALSVIFCALVADSAFAQKNIGWTGATNNIWTTATNWELSSNYLGSNICFKRSKYHFNSG